MIRQNDSTAAMLGGNLPTRDGFPKSIQAETRRLPPRDSQDFGLIEVRDLSSM